ncbi:MAG: tRNA (cmo5U34)-methyltransferase [Planctomycetota bacterium]|jgi:tRNA (cmo5U34)-methyltransferase
MQSASDYFDRIAAEYDDLIRRAVPVYELMLQEFAIALPADDGSIRRIVELGAGTGNASVVLARAYPGAELILVDAGSDMLDVAFARLGRELPGRTGACLRRVERFEEVEFEAGSVDLVTSSIALHHVQDKAALFGRVLPWLRPGLQSGGEVVFLDQMAGAGPRTDAILRGRYREFCRANCTETEERELRKHEELHDHHEGLPAYLDALRAAGFRDVDCTWRTAMWAIVTGRA